jgi:hypothetical protein
MAIPRRGGAWRFTVVALESVFRRASVVEGEDGDVADAGGLRRSW